MAAFYGRSVQADILTAVMVLPDLIYKFLSEGLISGAAVPIFVKSRDNKELLHKAFWSIFKTTAMLGMLVSILLVIGADSICQLIMPGVNSAFEGTLRNVWLLLVPYLLLGLLSGVQTSLLNANFSFAKPAVGSLLVNLSIILGTFIAAGGSIEIIAAANTIGALIQVIWLFWLIYKDNILEKGIENGLVYDKSIAKDFLRASAPLMAWISILPLIPVYERNLLSANQGSISTLNYTEKLFNLPLGVLSISLAHVILPRLSQLKGKDRRRFLTKAILFASVIILPIMGGIWFGADCIVRIVFMRGRFSLEDAKAAAQLFRLYIIALLPVSLNMMLNRGFFSSGNFRIPFMAGLASALLQLYICYKAVNAYALLGIAIAVVSAGFFQLIILLLAQYWVGREAETSS